MKKFKKMKRKKLCVLFMIMVFALSVIIGIEVFRNIKIYQMPINAWKRTTYAAPYKNGKEEHYVLYHTYFKSDSDINHFIIDFNDQTISRDSIEKYYGGFERFFFKRSCSLNKEYKETENGSDIIFDHTEDMFFYIKWKLEDSIAYVQVDAKYYKIPINDTTWSIITSVRKIEEHPKYLYRTYTRRD